MNKTNSDEWELSLARMHDRIFGAPAVAEGGPHTAPLGSVRSCLKLMGRCVFELGPVYIKD